MRKFSCLMLSVICVLSAFAQQPALWLRYPAISPDGKTVIFSYKGDLV